MLYPEGTLGLGILSWRGAPSLDHALQSYKRAHFFDLFDEAMIYLPDPDEQVLEVAEKYPIRIETSSDNSGILTGMEQIAERLKTDYIFFTENDNPLLETQMEARRQIRKALALLAGGKAVMARMRHVREPGEAFNTLSKYHRYYPEPDTFPARLRRTLRPFKAKRLCGTAIYGSTNPDKRFPAHIKDAGDGFHLVSSAVMPWTNQSILIKRDFFLDTILPFAKSVPNKAGNNGFPNLEIELNRSKFWRRSGWHIACGPGLLTHKRIGARGYE